MKNKDLEIAQAATIQPIQQIAEKYGISEQTLEPYGHYKAKLPLHLFNQARINRSKLILVTAMTPTPAGEGKTTVSIGLNDGLNRIGKQSIVALREPSLGPVFGIKGGAAGGGHSQVIPMEDINLHFTGDFAAIEKANNLLAALIDNTIHNTKDGCDGIDPRTVLWKRVIDMNDRALRDVTIGLGGKSNGMPREEGFNITAASEVMAIVGLSENMADLKRKLGNILLGFNFNKEPIYARDLGAEGAMALLLKDAIKPNVVQTLEGNMAIIHGGPFANIAQGTNSLIGTKMAMSHADYVVTEAGFGSDLGAEKFFDLKCQYGGIQPHAAVVVATVRALKYHGGVPKEELNAPNAHAVSKGMENLEQHVANVKKFGLPVIVALNHFVGDTQEELDRVTQRLKELDIQVALAEGWARGSQGTQQLAEMVAQAADSGQAQFRPFYDWNDRVEDKIDTLVKGIYGAAHVEYGVRARRTLRMIDRLGLGNLPLSIAKTQSSLSDNPKLLGAPKGFTATVREIEIAAGAGFIIPIMGNMLRMPGLPKTPAAMRMDISSEGHIEGLF